MAAPASHPPVATESKQTRINKRSAAEACPLAKVEGLVGGNTRDGSSPFSRIVKAPPRRGFRVVRLLADARVDPRADSLFLDDPLQQGGQAPAIGLAHPTRQLLLVLRRDPAPMSEQLSPRGGQIEGADPAVARMRTPLDQAALLELVDDRDHAAGRRPDRLADRLLRLALRGVDDVEDPEQRRMQIDLTDALGEAPRGVGPDLR